MPSVSCKEVQSILGAVVLKAMPNITLLGLPLNGYSSQVSLQEEGEKKTQDETYLQVLWQADPVPSPSLILQNSTVQMEELWKIRNKYKTKISGLVFSEVRRLHPSVLATHL